MSKNSKSSGDINIEELRLLNRIGREFSSSLELDSVIDTIMNKVKEVLKCEASSVIIYNEKTDELCFYGASGAGAGQVKGMGLPRGKGIAWWVFEHNKPAVANNAEEDSRFYSGIDKITGIKTTSLVCVPIEKGGKVIGVVEAINKSRFSPRDVELLQAISRLAGISLENSMVHKNIKNKNYRLFQMNREMGQFVHLVSHELQTPLASIKGYIQLIHEEMSGLLQENPSLNAYIERIEHNSKEMLSFVRKLVAYIKLNNIKIHLDNFNPASVLDEVLTALSGKIENARAKVKLCSGFKNIHYDRYLFYQVWTNFIQNSVERVRSVKGPVIEIGVIEKSNQVHFYIRDNGPRVPEEEAPRVFDLGNLTNKDLSGMDISIGLAYVKKAVEMLGGQVWVDNSSPVGSTYLFSVPHQHKAS
ncbi:MAG: GAF domain-containing protein [Spirochaetota bacterium]